MVIELDQPEPLIFGTYMQLQDPTIKYFAYMRKSSDDSTEKQTASLDTQKAELDRMIEHGRLNVVEFFQEAKTAKQPGREAFNEMLDRIEKGEADGILTWKLDRIARNPIDSGRVQWLLQTGKIQLIKTYERDYRPQDHSIVASVEMSMATQYSRDLKSMAYRTIRAKLAKGQPPYPAPVGFLNDTSKPEGDRGWIPDPERFNLVREMWTLLLTGVYSPSRIQKMISEKGLRTKLTRKQGGKVLNQSHVYKIFHDAAYYGQFSFIDPDTRIRQLWQGSYEPMISKIEFDRAQNIMSEKGKPHPTKKITAYGGLIRCADPNCDSSIISDDKNQKICSNCKSKFDCDAHSIKCPKCEFLVADMTSKKLHYSYWRCSRRKNPSCTQRKYTKLSELEDQINQELENLDIDTDYLSLALEYLNTQKDQEFQTHDDGRKLLQHAINEVNTRLKRISDEYASPQNIDYGIYTPDEYKTLKANLLVERNKLESQSNNKQVKLDRTLELSEKTFNLCAYAYYHFNNDGIDAQRAILRSIGKNLTLKDQKLNIGEYEPFLIIKNTLEVIKSDYKMLGTTNNVKTLNKNKLPELVDEKLIAWLPG